MALVIAVAVVAAVGVVVGVAVVVGVVGHRSRIIISSSICRRGGR